MTPILGLTCISEQLKEIDKKKYSFRTMTRKRFHVLCNRKGRDEALNQLSERILHNTIVTQHIVHHCHSSNIGHYRLSSAIFPLLTDQTLEISLEDLPQIASIKQALRLIGIIAKTLNISIGSHPDQFNVLASKNEDAICRTINELNFQASIFDMIGLPQNHTAPMNIHINAPLPDIENEDVNEINDHEKFQLDRIACVADKFYNNLMKCDQGVCNRLTIENEDRGSWNVDNIIKFSDYIFEKYDFNLPICYDNLHDLCNPSEIQSIPWQAERCAYTWAEECSPVFHWSEGLSEKPRAHANYFSYMYSPPYIAIRPDQEVKWECEIKSKDKGIKLLQENLSRETIKS
jgi:UV DNA damage repair endonuclease